MGDIINPIHTDYYQPLDLRKGYRPSKLKKKYTIKTLKNLKHRIKLKWRTKTIIL